MSLFVDTSFWVALANSRDPHAARAAELHGQHMRELLVTSNHVISETWTVLRARGGHEIAVAATSRILRSARVEVVHAGPDIERLALSWLRDNSEQPYSFVDAVSFVLMEARDITSALTFDRHFEAAGFVMLGE